MQAGKSKQKCVQCNEDGASIRSGAAFDYRYPRYFLASQRLANCCEAGLRACEVRYCAFPSFSSVADSKIIQLHSLTVAGAA